jgi:hypothetical protein
MAASDSASGSIASRWLTALRPSLSRQQRRASRAVLICCFGALVGGVDIIESASARATARFEPPPPRPARTPAIVRQAPRETAIRNPRLSPVTRPRLAPVIREP